MAGAGGRWSVAGAWSPATGHCGHEPSRSSAAIASSTEETEIVLVSLPVVTLMMTVPSPRFGGGA